MKIIKILKKEIMEELLQSRKTLLSLKPLNRVLSDFRLYSRLVSKNKFLLTTN